jgi:MurNAc alpha-1-phosphate uridylyltransferase
MMDAMLLAAGRGERMRPLSDKTPKPLLKVREHSLIEWQILALSKAGYKRVVINHAWLGNQIEKALGNGNNFGVEIIWSPEDVALGTAGGIVQALSKLRGDAFLVASADIYTDFDYGSLSLSNVLLNNQNLAHLILVDDHRVSQDFDLSNNRVIQSEKPSLTYGNIGVYRRSFFDGLIPGQSADLGNLLRKAVQADQVSGLQHLGKWDNVGTPTDLARVNNSSSLRS